MYTLCRDETVGSTPSRGRRTGVRGTSVETRVSVPPSEVQKRVSFSSEDGGVLGERPLRVSRGVPDRRNPLPTSKRHLFEDGVLISSSGLQGFVGFGVSSSRLRWVSQ